MTAKQLKKENARRKLLKGIAAGSGAVIAGKTLPESWSRPVVDSVMLPVHAQTSPASPTSFTGRSEQAAMDTGPRFARALDGLVNKAHAGPDADPTFSADSCIRENGDGTVRVDCLLYESGVPPMKLSALSVTVAGAAETMDGMLCGVDMIEQNNNAFLTNGLGLIPDAHALVAIHEIQVEIYSVNGRAKGRYLISGGEYTLDIDLPAGDCSAPQCPGGMVDQ